MPNNLRIFDNNLCLGTSVVLSISSAQTTVPGTNILQPNRKQVWRSISGTTAATAVFDLGAARDVNTFGLVSGNLGTAGTVTVQGHTADSWATPTYNSGALAVYDNDYTGVLLYYLGATKNLRYWRAILDDPGNADNYLEAGVAWLGTYSAMERNFSYGWEIEPVSLSRTVYALDGTPYTDEMGEYRRIALDVKFLTEEFAVTTFLPLIKRVSDKKDVILALFPERRGDEGTALEHGLNFYGRIEGPRLRNTSSWRWGVSLSFRETPG